MWDGETSTPADEETRGLRRQCHEEFDRLWKDRPRRFTRTEAYQWLARVMNVDEKEAHIGMFDKDQCERLLRKVRRLNE